MEYILTNGKNYLMLNAANKMSCTTQESQALKFRSKEKASNALKNLPKTIVRLGYRVQELSDGDDIIQDDNPGISTDREVEIDFDSQYSLESILDIVSAYEDLITALRSAKPYLESRKQVAEQEILDIEHAVEFYNFNAYEGFKMYKLLKEKRMERRKAKDQLMILEILEEYITPQFDINLASDRISNLSNRKYRPRVNKKIFEKG